MVRAKLLYEYRLHKESIQSLCFSVDGKWLFSASNEGHISSYDALHNFQPVRSLDRVFSPSESGIVSLAYSEPSYESPAILAVGCGATVSWILLSNYSIKRFSVGTIFGQIDESIGLILCLRFVPSSYMPVAFITSPTSNFLLIFTSYRVILLRVDKDEICILSNISIPGPMFTLSSSDLYTTSNGLALIIAFSCDGRVRTIDVNLIIDNIDFSTVDLNGATLGASAKSKLTTYNTYISPCGAIGGIYLVDSQLVVCSASFISFWKKNCSYEKADPNKPI